MHYSTYILRCADSTLYTGITTDLHRRTQEHNTDNKKGAKYTKNRRPVELIYFEEFSDRSEACRREYAIKQLSKDEKLKLIYS
ncbi:GIY-YIG nuclease family protein [Candidatus Gracilibacteria bacterium]|nr:GIY-YIG nuclease family protein [Candidatus Gracilibacteria bacterium]